VDSLIILDRRVDMITPFLTQLTYEGLIDELIGIKNCMSRLNLDLWYLYCLVAHVELPMSLLAPPNAQNQPNVASGSQASSSAAPVIAKKENKKKHHFTTATDPLFAELRDLNFSAVGRKLNRVAHRLDENYKVRVFYPTQITSESVVL
jgi:hypothetical protein